MLLIANCSLLIATFSLRTASKFEPAPVILIYSAFKNNNWMQYKDYWSFLVHLHVLTLPLVTLVRNPNVTAFLSLKV